MEILSEVDVIKLDHNYCRPQNWIPEHQFARKAIFIFVNQSRENNNDSVIDVDTVDERKAPPYDNKKALESINDIEKHISLFRSDPGDIYWDENINKDGWSRKQCFIFEQMANIFKKDALGRLACANNPNEAVLKRIQINKSTKRLRQLLTEFKWETKLLQWLHNILIEKVDQNTLIAYVDILQRLKIKNPVLLEKIISYNQQFHPENCNFDALKILISRRCNQYIFTPISLKPLPGNPLLLLVASKVNCSQQYSRWLEYFKSLGSVHFVNATVQQNSTISLVKTLDYMLNSTKNKLAELKAEHPNRSVVLIGFSAGASLVIQIAAMEKVNAIIAMSFHVNTLDGKRGDLSDVLYSTNAPILFINGEKGRATSIDEIETIRDRLTVESGLVVVGGADDYLKLTKDQQSYVGVNQTMIDAKIVIEISEFLEMILTTPRHESRLSMRNDYNNSSILDEYGDSSMPIDIVKRNKTITVVNRPVQKTPRLRISTPFAKKSKPIQYQRNSKILTITGSTKDDVPIVRGINSKGNDSPQRQSKHDMFFNGETTPSKQRKVTKDPSGTSKNILINKTTAKRRVESFSNDLVNELTPDLLRTLPVILTNDPVDIEPSSSTQILQKLSQKPNNSPIKVISGPNTTLSGSPSPKIFRHSYTPKYTRIILDKSEPKMFQSVVRPARKSIKFPTMPGLILDDNNKNT